MASDSSLIDTNVLIYATLEDDARRGELSNSASNKGCAGNATLTCNSLP